MSDPTAEAIDLALHLIEAADDVVVTTIDDRILSSTSPQIGMLAKAQLESGHGPTVEALAGGRVSRVNCMTDAPWHDIREFCDANTIRSILALPVIVDGKAVAVITITSTDHHAFGAMEIRLGRAIADNLAKAATPAVADAHPDEMLAG